MKPATQAVHDTLEQDMAVRAQPRLIAEWEYNRYYVPTVTVSPDQTTTDNDWIVSYDLNSVVLPFRPAAGISRARADSGVIPLGEYRDPGTHRYYPTPDVPLYSYFASLQRSQLALVDGAYPFDDKISVTTLYDNAIAVNKIVVGFENGYALPASFSIQVSPDGNAWQTINTDAVIAPDGTVTLWHSGGAGSGWGGTGWDIEATDYVSPVVIMGVRLNVYSMNQPYSHLDLLQISPRLENDLTDYLINYEVDMSQDSPSFIAPLGKASSNTATVTLSNIDGRFNNENQDSLYAGMIGKKVRFKMDLGIDTSGHGGSGYEYIREFTMWTDTWGASDNSTIDVALKDSSVLLQEATMPSMFLENATVAAIVWQTLDTIGMTNYQVTRSDQDTGQVVPFYWPSDTAEASNPRWGRLMVSQTNPPTTTIWDELSALCESTQTALFFDENDVLQIKTRQAMFYSGKTVDWNLDAVKNGVKMPDIVTTQANWDLTTNQVEITYKPCAFSDDQNGFPKMETVWTPQAAEDNSIVPSSSSSTGDTTVTLRSTALAKDLIATTTDYFWIHQADAAFWPYESDVNIEGEYVHYKGKEYGYYDENNTLAYAVCLTLSDQQSYDAKNANLSFKNAYTGKLAITARGEYGTLVKDHYVVNPSYTSLATDYDNTIYAGLGSSYVTQNDGYITQNQAPKTRAQASNGRTYHLRKHNQSVPPVNGNTVWYGTRIRFTSNGLDASPTRSYIGGLFFGGDQDGGYYLECTPSTQIDGYEQRKYRNELCLIGMPVNGKAFQVKGDNGDPKGYQVPWLPDQWYQLDVSFVYNSNTASTIVGVYLNGQFAGSWTLTSGRPNYTNTWRFGTHVRGPSSMDIDYLYALGQDDTNPLHNPDQTAFLDIVSGGYQSQFARVNMVYATDLLVGRTWPSGQVYYSNPLSSAHAVFDEYGPVVHEVRTFDVQFSDQYIPVTSSYLYMTNPQVECLSYQSDASGATFMLANASRQNAIVNGEDDVTFGADNSVTQSLMIYGRVIYTAQNDRLLIKKDDAAIRRQGLIRTQFTSRYIQSDEMADSLGQWILDLWATGIDQVDAELFGNPLIQVGDLVTVNFPSKGMSPSTHKYYVTAVKGNFDTGYKTTVTLRRARV